MCPWVIWGTYAYAVSCFLGASEVSLLKYISYLSGYNTWLYYVPVYFTILLVYNTVKLSLWIFALIIIGILSIVTTYIFNLLLVIVITVAIVQLLYIFVKYLNLTNYRQIFGFAR